MTRKCVQPGDVFISRGDRSHVYVVLSVPRGEGYVHTYMRYFDGSETRWDQLGYPYRCIEPWLKFYDLLDDM